MTSGLQVAYGKAWWPSLNALTPVDMSRVGNAVERFIDDPDHPSLNLHPVKGDGTGRLHTFRASDELRVLLAKQGGVVVLLEAGHHDAVYERALRMQFVANPHTGFVGLIEVGPRQEPDARPYLAVTVDRPRPLDHWTDDELREAGCTNADIVLVRDCPDESALCGLPDALLERVLEIIDKTPEQWRTPALDPEAEAATRLKAAIEQFGVLAGFTPLLGAEEAKALAAAPIEDWMVFLHPDQRGAVLRRYDGPARVRGSAGTGKTVVGLHRAAELAARYPADDGPILFTTFINSLPPVFENLFERIPGATRDRVEFVNVDKLANEICKAGGVRLHVDSKAIDAAFASAWSGARAETDALKAAGLTRDYVREEITAVIKGRGLANLDEYRGVERTGRRTRLPGSLREAVWALRIAWDEQMRVRGTVDFADRLIAALDVAKGMPQPRYRAAIIDEAQDVTLVGLAFVRALVNGAAGIDRPDGLLIVGDGAQRIYPGGFTLRQAGVEVRGRTTVLRVNYRNTREVIEAAMAVAGGGEVDDLGDEYHRSDERASAEREGARPTLVLANGHADELDYIVRHIQKLVDDELVGHGDIAIAVSTNQQVKDVEQALKQHGIPAQTLANYTGVPTAAVKVGTHFRIKGLEFKVVFLPFLGATEFPRARIAGQSDDEYAEQCDRALSQLFVAMTRARDQLFVVATGEPAAVLANAVDRFRLTDTSG